MKFTCSPLSDLQNIFSSLVFARHANLREMAGHSEKFNSWMEINSSAILLAASHKYSRTSDRRNSKLAA